MAAPLPMFRPERGRPSPAERVREADRAAARLLRPEPEPVLILFGPGRSVALYGQGATADNAAAEMCRVAEMAPNRLVAQACEGEPLCCGVMPRDPSRPILATVYGLDARAVNHALITRGAAQ